jgi:hypothetical protein
VGIGKDRVEHRDAGRSAGSNQSPYQRDLTGRSWNPIRRPPRPHELVLHVDHKQRGVASRQPDSGISSSVRGACESRNLVLGEFSRHAATPPSSLRIRESSRSRAVLLWPTRPGIVPGIAAWLRSLASVMGLPARQWDGITCRVFSVRGMMFAGLWAQHLELVVGALEPTVAEPPDTRIVEGDESGRPTRRTRRARRRTRGIWPVSNSQPTPRSPRARRGCRRRLDSQQESHSETGLLHIYVAVRTVASPCALSPGGGWASPGCARKERSASARNIKIVAVSR